MMYQGFIKKITEQPTLASVTCITTHPGFSSVCLNKWVLQTAFYGYVSQYGGKGYTGPIHESVKQS
jgi:hypothetical protein